MKKRKSWFFLSVDCLVITDIFDKYTTELCNVYTMSKKPSFNYSYLVKRFTADFPRTPKVFIKSNNLTLISHLLFKTQAGRCQAGS